MKNRIKRLEKITSDADTEFIILIEDEDGSIFINGKLASPDELAEIEKKTTKTIIVDNIDED